MSIENKTISITLDAETERLLNDAATLSGMSVEKFCLTAIAEGAERAVFPDGRNDAFTEESLESLKKLAETRERIFNGRTLPGNSADLIREAREERHRDMEGHGNPAREVGILVWGKPPFTEETAEKLLATRDQIFQGRVSSTDSVDLVREARERRGKRQEELGGS